MKKIIVCLLAVILILLTSCSVVEDDLQSFKNWLLMHRVETAAGIYSELSEEKKHEADDFVKNSVDELKESYFGQRMSYDEVYSLLSQYIEYFPACEHYAYNNREYIQKHENSLVLLSRAKERMNTQDYIGAISILNEISNKFEEYSEVEKLRTEAETAYIAKVEKQCEDYKAQGNWVALFGEFRLAEKNSISSQYFSLLKEDYIYIFKTECISNANDLAQANYKEAINYLEEMQDIYYCDEFDSKIDEYELLNEQKIINDTLAKAESLAAQKEWGEAIAALKAVEDEVDSEKIEEKIKEYECYLPKKLTQIERYGDKENCNLISDFTDKFGKAYKEALNFYSYVTYIVDSGKEGYVEYKIDGNFNTFKFTLTTYDYNLTHGEIRIYSNNKLIAEYTDIATMSEPKEITLDITGTVFLKIESYIQRNGRESAYIYICDPIVSNE